MKISPRCLSTIAIALIAGLGSAQAVNLAQVDTFEDGTTQGWVVGLLGALNPAPPVNVSTGGPAGTDDNYLRLTSLGGQGPGSRLSAISFQGQWAGDYLAAGVGRITMDVNNFGPDELYLRLALSDPLAGPPQNLAFSEDAVFLPAGSGWTRISFSLEPDDLIGLLGNVESALAGATELRIYHSQAQSAPNPVSPILPVVASLGVDNIRAGAAPVPEVASTLLLGCLPLGLLVLSRSARRLARVE